MLSRLETNKTKLFKTTFLLLVSLLSSQSSAFWLTDSSLFVSPPALNSKTPEVAAVIDLSTGADISNELAQSIESSRQNLVQKQVTRKEQQQEECSCNSNWLQNQTNSFLNNWLKSANFANQIQRLLPVVSNSTGAPNQPLDGKRGDAKLQPNLNSNHHWSLWPRSFLSEGIVGGSGGKPTSASGASQANGSPNGAGHSNNRYRKHKAPSQQQQQVKVVQGPKGESGARGPSGLISVPNRKALFELAGSKQSMEQSSSPSTTLAESKYEQLANRLVFVEAEQVLVLRTTSGWQPLAMLAPLRETPLSQAPKVVEQRRRLISQKTTTSNSIRGVKLATDVTNNQLASSISIDLDDDSREGPVVVDDDEDDDDDEEDEDDDDDDDEGTDDEDDFAELDENDISPRGKQVEKKALLTGRSALAAAAPEVEPSTSGGGQMKLRLAALNEPFSGNIHGLRGADFECKRNAAKANIKGSFRAFLASGLQNLNEIVRHNIHKYPIVNLRGDTLANSWHDFFRQPARFPNPLSRVYSFDGRHVASDPKWPNKLIWHGANNKLGHKDLTNNCDGWHSDSLSKFGFGTPIHYHRFGTISSKRQRSALNNPPGRKRRLAGTGNGNNNTEEVAVLELTDRYPCKMPLIVLCIETIGQQLSSSNLRSSNKITFDQNNI